MTKHWFTRRNFRNPWEVCQPPRETPNELAQKGATNETSHTSLSWSKNNNREEEIPWCACLIRSRNGVLGKNIGESNRGGKKKKKKTRKRKCEHTHPRRVLGREESPGLHLGFREVPDKKICVLVADAVDRFVSFSLPRGGSTYSMLCWTDRRRRRLYAFLSSGFPQYSVCASGFTRVRGS